MAQGGWGQRPDGFGVPPEAGVVAATPGGGGGGGGQADLDWSPTEAFGFAWRKVKADFAGVVLPFFVANLAVSMPVSVLVGGATFAYILLGGVDARHPPPMTDPGMLALRFGGQAINVITTALIIGGLVSVALKVVRGEKPSVGDGFSGVRLFLPILAAMLLSGLAICIGLVLCVVPGVIVGAGLSLTYLVMVEQKLGPIDAMKESWRLTAGIKGKLIVFGLLSGVVLVVGFCACCVGVFVAVPIVYVAHAYIYSRVRGLPTLESPP